ncbi:MAG: PAS domain S-box protein [Prolixibacteraceae bacterium]|nr:PAS domain S-box protein [Prolixibacteraceae bacterium]MBN2649645.1 PAS domain S-box protein [Prolixibacteraceae bacterium]
MKEDKNIKTEPGEAIVESLLKISQYPADSKQDLLDFVLDEAISLTDSEFGYIYLYSEKTKEFTLNTWSKEVMDVCKVDNPQTIYHLDKTGLWGEAVRQRKPIVLNDFNAPNPFKKGYPVGHAPLKKFLTIPVFSNDEIVAVVGLANKPDNYTQADIRRIILLMDVVWKIVLQNRIQKEHQKAVAALNESENRFLMLAKSASVGIVIADSNQNILFVSDQFTNILGYTLSDIPNITTWSKLAIPKKEYREKIMGEWQEYIAQLKQESVVSVEKISVFKVYCKDGRVKDIELRVSFESGMYNIFFADVTEKVEAKQIASDRLKELSAFYKLSEMTEQYSWSLNHLLSNYVEVLPKSLQHSPFAYARIMLYHDEYFSNNYKENACCVIKSPLIIHGESVGELEVGYLGEENKQEKEPFLQEQYQLVNSIAKRLSRIAEHIQTEESLALSEARFRNLLSQMQFGVAIHEIILDKNGVPVNYRFLEVNPAFENITGLPRESIIGKTVLEILPNTEKEWIERFGQVALSGKSVHFENYARELKRYYSVVAYRTQPMQFAVITEDVTSRKKILLEIERSNQKFKLLSRSATYMLSLKTPDEIYSFITQSLHKQYPNAVILFLLVDEASGKSNVVEIAGIENKLLNKVIKITGFDFTQKRFNLNPYHLKIFKSGQFHAFEKGLADFSGNQFPSIAAQAIEKLVGIKNIYTIGINKDDNLFATIHFLNRGSEPITDADYIESFVMQAGIVIDRKHADQRISASEAKFREIFNSTNEAIFIYQPETGAVLYCNRAAEQMYGYTIDEFYQIDISDYSAVEEGYDLEKGIEMIQNVLKNDKYTFEWRNRRKDGSTFWNEISLRRVYLEGQERVVAVCRDISERKKVEADMVKLSLVAQQNPASIVVTDLGGNIEYVNKRFTEATGYTSDEVMGQNPRILNSGQNPPDVYKGLWDKLIKGKEWNGIFQNRKKNGETYWEKALISPVKNTHGETISYLAIKEDITEQLEAQQALVESEARLKQALDTKNKFFSIVSHDLRSPISTIVNLTELLSDKSYHFTNEEIATYLQSMHQTADSTYRLLENLLEWSRLQRGIISFTPENLDVADFLKSCDLSIFEKAKAKNVELDITFSEKLSVYADENMLRTILRNLLSNAIKFTKRGGKVVLEVQKTKNGDALFMVRDNGIGMSNDMLNKLFDIAENVSRPGTENESSSGLGLILCKEFVEKHGGKIWVESAEGKGSTFWFTINTFDENISG